MTHTHKTGAWRWLKGFMFKHTHNMITCKEFEEFVLSYLDGDLPVKQRSMFEWHIRICRDCREYLAAYQRAIELGQAVLPTSDQSLPGDVPEDLIKAILKARKV